MGNYPVIGREQFAEFWVHYPPTEKKAVVTP